MSETGDPIDLEVDLNVDQAAAEREFAAIAKVIEKAITKGLGKGFDRVLSDIEKRLGGVGGGARGFDNLGKAARGVTEDFQRTARATADLGGDIDALKRRTEAMRETLQKAGARPELFDVINVELEKVLRLQADFNDHIEAIANDPTLLKGYEVAFQAARSTIFRETSGINESLRTLSTTQDREGQRANLILKDQLKEREQLAERARSEFVVNSQRESAQTLAETRIAGQRRLQSERQFARSRIEILRFTLNQVRTIERAIGSIFSGTASIAVAGIRKIEGAAQRIGKIFTRGNRELNDGLQPALLSRERSITRSFERQSTIINSSVNRQSRVIQRFEQQASSGLTGAVTGRSSLGSLLGGGLAIGGGFLLLDKLRAGFEESVNLNESLNKTRQVFGDASADIEAFANNSVGALFSVRSAALEAAGNFGIFGRAAGLQGQPLADFSKRLTVLATDLASFNNTSVDDAVVSLAAALRGESEPIRRYGVLLNEDVLQQRAFSEGIIDSVRKLTPAERVLAAYDEVLAQTAVQQGDAARTADDFANSSRRAAAASVETFAAIAGAAVPFATFLTNFTFTTLPKLTAFIEGNVGPAFLVLRDALIGAGAALGGLVAARGAVEVLQFLAIALRAVLTPMGLFLTAVAGIGAAFNILRDRSPDFAQAVRTVSGILTDVLGRGVDLVQSGLEHLSDLLDNTILPALGRFASFAAGALRTALQFGIGFIITVVIPGLRSFADLVTGTILPALERFGGFILDHIVPALRFLRDTAGDALSAIEPFLDPVIDGFGRLAGAITDAVSAAGSGDFSAILDGLTSFLTSISPTQIASAVGGTAIGTAIGGPIGGAIGAALGLGFGGQLRLLAREAIPILKFALGEVADFVTGFFTGKRLEGAAVGFLELVERIGRIVGSIVSDPKFVAALEGIVALAAATGFQFLKGFAEAVAKNVPAVAKQLASHIELLLTLAFREVLDHPLKFAKIFAAIFVGRAFLNLIRNNARAAGDQAATGFVGGFARTVQSGFQRNQFASGFFGGLPALQRSAAKFANDASATLLTERDRAVRNIERLGGTTIPLATFGPGNIRDDVNKQVAELQRLQGVYGETASSAVLLRTQVGDAARGIGFAFQGVGDSFGGDLEGGFSKARVGLKTFTTSVGDAFRTLRQGFRESGAALGQAVGGAILSGVGAALAGQAIGQGLAGGGSKFSLGLGLAGVISSALFGAAAVGGGPQGVVVGGAIAAIGLASTAVGFFGEKAAEAGRKAETAAARIDTLTTAMLNAKTISDQFQVLSSDFGEQVAGLGPNAQRILEVGQFDLAAFVREVQGGATAVEALNAALNANGQFLIGDAQSANDKGVKAVLGFADALKTEYDATVQAGALTELFTRNIDVTVDSLDRATAAVDDTGSAIDSAIGGGIGLFSRARSAVDDFGVRAIEAGRKVTGGLREPLDFVGDALKQLEEQRLDGLNNQIQGVRDSLGQARDTVQQTLEGITLLAGGPLVDPLQRAADQLVLALPNVAQSVSDAFQSGAQGADFNTAEFNESLRPFQDQINALFSQAVDTFGADLTPAKLTELFAPIQRTLDNLTIPTDVTDGEGNVTVQDVAISPEVRDALQTQLNNLLADSAVQSEIDKLAVEQRAVDDLNAQLEALNTKLPVDIIFTADQVAQALAELFPDLDIGIDPNALVARQLGLPAVSGLFRPGGGQGGTAGTELANDPELRAFLAAAVARDSVPAPTGPPTIVQGDLVAQKVEQQTFTTADRAEVAVSAQARAMRLAAGSIGGGLLQAAKAS